MLVIRLQRVGRKGHAHFRVVVQDSRRTPTSGKLVAHLGHYNPHSKEKVINKEKAQFYLDHGAQPSDRVVKLLKDEGVKLPSWVKLADPKKRDTRNPEKLRRNQPKEEPAPAEDTVSVSESEDTESTKAEPTEAANDDQAKQAPDDKSGDAKDEGSAAKETAAEAGDKKAEA